MEMPREPFARGGPNDEEEIACSDTKADVHDTPARTRVSNVMVLIEFQVIFIYLVSTKWKNTWNLQFHLLRTMCEKD